MIVTMKKRHQTAWLEKLNQCIYEHLSQQDLTIQDIATALKISERQLYRNIKILTNSTPNQYINQLRFQTAYQYLQEGKYYTVAEVANAIGFKDAGYFSKKFKAHFGISPLEV